MAISSEYDYKIISSNKEKYYSDMTSDITSNKKKFILVNNLLNTNMRSILNNVNVIDYFELADLENKSYYNSYYNKENLELYDSQLYKVEFKYLTILKENDLYVITIYIKVIILFLK